MFDKVAENVSFGFEVTHLLIKRKKVNMHPRKYHPALTSSLKFFYTCTLWEHHIHSKHPFNAIEQFDF